MLEWKSARGRKKVIEVHVCVLYMQLYNMVKKLKAGLTSWGVKPKDVVLLLSPNCPEFPIVYLAVVLLGAVVAPSNPLNTHADIAKQLAQASVKFMVTVPDLLSKIEGCALPTMLIGKYYFRTHAYELMSWVTSTLFVQRVAFNSQSF